MLWRLHLRPEPKNEKTHDDVVSYCINHHIAGIGWPVPAEVSSPEAYEQAARVEYGVRVASIPFAQDPIIGDYVWARDKNGNYYLGCIQGDWYYSNDPLHLELDIPNQRACEWIKVGSEENVPGKIVACFRPAKTFQAIYDPLMESFSKWAFSGDANKKFSATRSSQEFFRFIGSDDCEDIVGIYLQKVKGYYLIPSSCKQTTIGYEFILKHSITSKTAIAQVKQGTVLLDDRLHGIADHVFLFCTEGVVTADSNDFTVLQAEELYAFVCQNKKILPARINYWLEFLS
ncbi:hypothetical protein BWI93_17045 [Siphonobacter sp. BAB-5385]|uniref:hypothetical protein n=1 Tax=Siphonobacter sp. BAB-5385 TaxID=1864822 RepID=UPI000B9E8A40|nr:hypothetical protein [Siphonobacter sp. BAB-5385]OZI07012.1 hypothetical protein BWI93_17045 [Siphonobacter sp. BAB-5385]